MKVLWFAVTPSLYDKNNTKHNGGGWISSLEALVRVMPNIELGIAFEHSDSFFRVEHEDVTYYPLNVWQSRWQRLKRKFIYNTEENQLIPVCLKVIDDFKPDIIHIFGSEWCFGLLTKYTDIPVVIHMQGSIPPYYNARFPVGYSEFDFIRYYRFNLKKTISYFINERQFNLRAIREEKILHGCNYYMGRTEWDKNLIQLFAPNSKYFYCSEALREPFVNTNEIWKSHKSNNLILISTISNPLYKGFDLILKTAKLLVENTDIIFEWRVFGVTDVQFYEWKAKVKSSEVNVKLMGTVSAEKIRIELLDADIFIHPSYIDNSPNSICEAQLLGLPVISTNVGGISSLITHLKTGILVPSNDPFSLTAYIKLIFYQKDLAILLGNNALKTALIRHNNNTIKTDLMNVYNTIINYEKKTI